MNAENEPESTLIPASNFAVRSLKGLGIETPTSSIQLSGFGIWDLAAGGWVCFGATRVVRGNRVEKRTGIPYALPRKHVVAEAIAEGVWSGYDVVRL